MRSNLSASEFSTAIVNCREGRNSSALAVDRPKITEVQMRRKRMAVATALLVALNLGIALIPRAAKADDDGDRVCQCTGEGSERVCVCATYFQPQCWTAFFCT